SLSAPGFGITLQMFARALQILRLCGGFRQSFHFDLFETHAQQQGVDGAAGVVARVAPDSSPDGFLQQLSFRLLAHLRFKVGINADEKPGIARVDLGARIVEPRDEHLRRGYMNAHLFSLDPDIAVLETREVDAGYDLAMDDHQQPVTGNEIRQDRIVFLAGYDLVHVVHHGFQPLQPLNAVNYTGFAGDARAAPAQARPQRGQLPGLYSP